MPAEQRTQRATGYRESISAENTGSAHMKHSFTARLRCPSCGSPFRIQALAADTTVAERVLLCTCGLKAPVIAGVPRILPATTSGTLASCHPEFFARHPDLAPPAAVAGHQASARTLHAFGDEWQRFPELLEVHQRIFDWYFEGPEPVCWPGLKVLDAGCGMGRWLHFARRAGADIVGMDVSPAIDVAAAREGDGADFVQADLRWPPFPPDSFDLVYSLGVLHHLEEPLVGVRALAKLVRPGGELRFYVYRILDDEPWWKRALFTAVTGFRHVTTRLPYPAVHVVSWLVAVVASVLFLWPRRLLRRWPWGDRSTRHLPLVHYSDVPFQMVVSEQFDRLVAPIEGRFRREDVEAWLRDVGFEVVAILPGLGWRAIGRRPAADQS
jgi:SAM-dependent methyltransferase